MNRATQEYVNSPQLGAFQSALPNQGNYNPEMGAAYQELQKSRAADNAKIEPNKFGYKYDPVTGGVIKDESNMPAPAVANNSFNGFQDMMLYGNFNGGNQNDGTGDSNAGNNSGQGENAGPGAGPGAGENGSGSSHAFGGQVRQYNQGGIANLGGYSDGGQLLKGPGDGVSDDIPATIAGKQPARLANNEFVVPARIVSELGNGSTDAGAQALYKMMDRVQNARRKTMGKDNVAVDTRSTRYLPA
jgi:hypothetical protein